MPNSSNGRLAPAVSIILPTYNRAKFLPQAFESIRAQTWKDWELVIVDDGSTDETKKIVEILGGPITNPVRFFRQENQGPYAARNTGLDNATGKYIAFFDSDDYWLPHHLSKCVEALETNPQIDWVYGACQIVDYKTGEVRAPSHFYDKGKPQPFLRLHSRSSGDLKVIDDQDALRCAILHGFHCGLQHSVARRDVFSSRFRTVFRNEAEDQLTVIRALAAGRRLGYFDAIHVIYHEHDQNSSGAGTNKDCQRLLSVFQGVTRGFEELGNSLPLKSTEKSALRLRLSREYFWSMGYALLWQQGHRKEALQMFRRGIRHYPWFLGYWKTFILALIKTKLFG